MIINSLLDTDFYKFTMQQVVFHQFPDVNVEYKFKLRNYPPNTLLKHKDRIEKEVDNLCKLRFTSSELQYLRSIPFLSDGYIEFLRMFQLNRDNIDVTERDGALHIDIHGTWLNTILFETPVLAIVSECNSPELTPASMEHLDFKINYIRKYCKRPFRFIDFGTRRRHSRVWQNTMITTFRKYVPECFVGTSNVMFARLHNIKPIGTMAHEFVQAMQALTRLEDSQKYAFQCWANEYRGQLGIALSDTLGIDVFLRDFDLYFCKLFDGVRQDSGDPYDIANKVISHYYSLGVDPLTKTLVFSDGLTIPKAIELNEYFSDFINCSFGIGTNLTNNDWFNPPQIVIKMTRCNGKPVAKISDSKGKQMCEDTEYLKYLSSIFNIERENVNE